MVRRLLKGLPTALALLFLLLSINVIIHEFKEHNIYEILDYLSSISAPRKIGAIALTSLGYVTMTGYDLLGFRSRTISNCITIKLSRDGGKCRI